MPLRIVFMGTPDFAVPSLSALLEAGHHIVGVITAPDRRGGRGGNQLIESAVKKFAVRHQLRCLQPANLKHPDFISDLRALQADLQVVVAFRMLPEIVWNMPPMGTMNLHGSILPAYRGAAPINWAVIRGEKFTGVTTFLLRHAIDTGDILMQRTIPIGPDETAGEVHDRMMKVGAEVVVESVLGLEKGMLKGKPQDDSIASHAPKLSHETSRIDFHRPAQVVHNFIRGLSPYPTAWTRIDGMQLNVFRSEMAQGSVTVRPGTILSKSKTLEIACSDKPVRLLEVQMEGKKRMGAGDFLNGYQIKDPSVESGG